MNLNNLVIPWLYLQHHQQIKFITHHMKCVIGWVWHFWFWLKCLTISGWIAMEFDTHSHVPLRMNSNSLCDILISHLALSSGQNVHFSSTLVCDKVPQMLADYVFTTSCDANWPKRCSCKCSLHFLEHYYPCEFTRFTVSICLFSTITLAKWCSTIKLLFSHTILQRFLNLVSWNQLKSLVGCTMRKPARRFSW